MMPSLTYFMINNDSSNDILTALIMPTERSESPPVQGEDGKD